MKYLNKTSDPAELNNNFFEQIQGFKEVNFFENKEHLSLQQIAEQSLRGGSPNSETTFRLINNLAKNVLKMQGNMTTRNADFLHLKSISDSNEFKVQNGIVSMSISPSQARSKDLIIPKANH